MAVSRVLSPFVQRVIIANPLQVKVIAHAHVKTDKIDADTLAGRCMSDRSLREDSGGRVRKALQAIDDGDEQIVNPAVQLIHDPQPELGAFALLEPHAQKSPCRHRV